MGGSAGVEKTDPMNIYFTIPGTRFSTHLRAMCVCVCVCAVLSINLPPFGPGKGWRQLENDDNKLTKQLANHGHHVALCMCMCVIEIVNLNRTT